MEDSNKLSYFFLGLGIGVAAGVLFAPKSGEETRGYLRSRADESAGYLRRQAADLKENANDIVDRGRQAVARQQEQLRSAVDAGKRAYHESVHPLDEA